MMKRTNAKALAARLAAACALLSVVVTPAAALPVHPKDDGVCVETDGTYNCWGIDENCPTVAHWYYNEGGGGYSWCYLFIDRTPGTAAVCSETGTGDFAACVGVWYLGENPCVGFQTYEEPGDPPGDPVCVV